MGWTCSNVSTCIRARNAACRENVKHKRLHLGDCDAKTSNLVAIPGGRPTTALHSLYSYLLTIPNFDFSFVNTFKHVLQNLCAMNWHFLEDAPSGRSTSTYIHLVVPGVGVAIISPKIGMHRVHNNGIVDQP